MKKSLGLLAVLALTATTLVGCAAQPTQADYEKWAADNGYTKLEALPAARLAGKTGYVNADSGVQINPSEGQTALVGLLGRPDVRYVDLRNDGEGYVKGHIEGFESISYFQLIADTSSDKSGKQLFIETKHENNGVVTYSFVPRYNESEYLLKQLFPNDGKALFLMCGGGIRVVNMMFLLNQYGYDMTKVYNVGGWNMIAKVKGTANAVPVASEQASVAASVSYDFSKLTAYTPAA